MAGKTNAEVVIAGKVFTLSGYESEEYMQKVANYINGKITELTQAEGFKKQPIDVQNILIELNIADDYFKAKKQADILEAEIETKDKELYDLKHELIAVQIKLEGFEKNTKQSQKEINELQKKIVKLETEAADYKQTKEKTGSA